jgi:hypothetical protein
MPGFAFPIAAGRLGLTSPPSQVTLVSLPSVLARLGSVLWSTFPMPSLASVFVSLLTGSLVYEAPTSTGSFVY